MNASVRVIGGRELIADLGAVADGVEDAAKKASTASAELVAREASSRASSLGSVAGKSAPAVGVENEGDVAGVGLDLGAYPFAAGAEFGAVRFPQFDAYTGPDGGYFIAPTVDATEQRVVDIHADEIGSLLERHDL